MLEYISLYITFSPFWEMTVKEGGEDSTPCTAWTSKTCLPQQAPCLCECSHRPASSQACLSVSLLWTKFPKDPRLLVRLTEDHPAGDLLGNFERMAGSRFVNELAKKPETPHISIHLHDLQSQPYTLELPIPTVALDMGFGWAPLPPFLGALLVLSGCYNKLP